MPNLCQSPGSRESEAGRFGATGLARLVWRRRFGAGPFWRTAVLAQDVLAQIYTDKYTLYGS